MDFTTLIGSAGALILLLVFFLNESHKISQDSLSYDLLNFIGAVLLASYAFILKSTPFLFLNSIWALVALRDIVIDLKRKW